MVSQHGAWPSESCTVNRSGPPHRPLEFTIHRVSLKYETCLTCQHRPGGLQWFAVHKRGLMMSRSPLWFLPLALVASFVPAAPVPGVDSPPFGSQIVWPENTSLATYADRLQSAGVKWARSELIWWGTCEQTPGVYQFNVGAWNCDNWIS